MVIMVYADLEQARKRLDASAQSRILQRPDGVARTWSGRMAAGLRPQLAGIGQTGG
jgi:hypothetical protein